MRSFQRELLIYTQPSLPAANKTMTLNLFSDSSSHAFQLDTASHLFCLKAHCHKANHRRSWLSSVQCAHEVWKCLLVMFKIHLVHFRRHRLASSLRIWRPSSEPHRNHDSRKRFDITSTAPVAVVFGRVSLGQIVAQMWQENSSCGPSRTSTRSLSSQSMSEKVSSLSHCDVSNDDTRANRVNHGHPKPVSCE